MIIKKFKKCHNDYDNSRYWFEDADGDEVRDCRNSEGFLTDKEMAIEVIAEMRAELATNTSAKHFIENQDYFVHTTFCKKMNSRL